MPKNNETFVEKNDIVKIHGDYYVCLRKRKDHFIKYQFKQMHYRSKTNPSLWISVLYEEYRRAELENMLKNIFSFKNLSS